MRAGAKRLVLFIVTIAVGLIIQNIVLIIYGGASLAFTLPSSAPHHVGPLLLTSRDEWIIAAGVIAMLLIHVLLRYTKFGKAQRAVSDSRALARTTGINVDQIVQLTWLLAGAMAGFAGFVLGASVGTLSPTLGFSFLLVIFAAGIVGGIGKPYGAMAGALLIGMAMEISALYLPADYKEVIAFGLLILTLLVRPYGLFTTVRGVPQ
jgi:branched-subunit amino acid ABC-type transport system permease component